MHVYFHHLLFLIKSSSCRGFESGGVSAHENTKNCSVCVSPDVDVHSHVEQPQPFSSYIYWVSTSHYHEHNHRGKKSTWSWFFLILLLFCEYTHIRGWHRGLFFFPWAVLLTLPCVQNNTYVTTNHFSLSLWSHYPIALLMNITYVWHHVGV